MICAMDFGSCWIRSVFRNPKTNARLCLYTEKAEYALLESTDLHRKTLEGQGTPFADCEGSIVVAGNYASKAQWLSRVPCAPLLVDGLVPIDDPPARQMLSVLTEAMLPPASGPMNLCIVTVPGVPDGSAAAKKSEEFLCRLIQMRGYHPLVVHPAEAALLATCSEAAFTGISIVMGAETTGICIARYGMPLVLETLPIGSNWIDSEVARQFQVQVFDEQGSAYLDIEAIRQWKLRGNVDLRNATGDRERMMSRLYSVVLERISRTVAQLLSAADVRNALKRDHLSVMLSGGATLMNGFSALLTERFIEHEIADRIQSVRCAADPETAVVRGALIFGEVEARALLSEGAA